MRRGLHPTPILGLDSSCQRTLLLLIPNSSGLYPLILLLLLFLGHIEVVKFLIEACKVNPFVKDRWGNIPLDDAVQFNHLEVVKLLQDYQDSYTLSQTQAEAEAEDMSKENLESMV